MKPQLFPSAFESLRKPPILRKWDWAVLLVTGLLWYGAVMSRDQVIDRYCIRTPELCTPEQVPAIDRFMIQSEDSRADGYSYVTQNLSGVFALSGSLLIAIIWIALRRQTPRIALKNLGIDWVLILQTTLINGLLTEVTRLIVQRPRPFVFANAARGGDAANYTAFFSGHTSFAAAAMTALWFVLLSRGAPRWTLALTGATGFTLVFLTAVYRVLAGRHFLTDTIVAVFAGFAVAWCVAYFHRPLSVRS